MLPSRIVPDAFRSALLALFVVVVTRRWTAVSSKVLATQMSARVVTTQYGKLRGVLVTLSNRRLPFSTSTIAIYYHYPCQQPAAAAFHIYHRHLLLLLHRATGTCHFPHPPSSFIIITHSCNRRLPLVEAYLGLQYASLLDGDLRFMPPTSTTEKWDGIRVALRYRPVCPQSPPPPPAAGRDAVAQTSSRDDHIDRLPPFLDVRCCPLVIRNADITHWRVHSQSQERNVSSYDL